MSEGIILRDGKESDREGLRTIGTTIQSRRQELGMSLRQLSKLSGLSIGFLSRVERGQSLLALTSLSNIAKALQIELSRFFPTEEVEQQVQQLAPLRQVETALPYVHRANDAAKIATISSSRSFKLLSPRGHGMTLEPILVTVQPGESADEPYSHEGEEFAYVLSGEFVFVVNDVEYRLGPGDSIYLQATVRHTTRNVADVPAQILWVLTPRLM